MTSRVATFGRLGAKTRPILSSRLFWIWIAIWVVTRGLMVVQVGFWNHHGVELQDVNSYESWSNYLAEGHLPTDSGWQYPPGAAFLMLLPRIGGASFGPSFVVTMLLFDLAGLGLIAILARREHREIGVWVWLLGMPLLQMFPVLRFDLVPTVLMIAALVVIHRRPGWFGALAGLGAAVKVWPIVVLFGEWQRRRLAIAAAVALATIGLTFVIAGISFDGSQTLFLDNQDVRGLQVEAVATTPWYAREMVTGTSFSEVPRNGALEIGSGVADAIAQLLKWLAVVVLVAAALWWVARERAIRRGRTALASAEVSRDFVFTLVMLLTVVSRVLSIQYMIWMVGLSAVILSGGTRRMSRPAWVVIGAVVLSAGLYQSPSNMVIRNLALLIASIDAAIAMCLVLRKPAAELTADDRANDAHADGHPPERRLSEA